MAFTVGQVVQLNSGGPLMTVEKSVGDLVTCVWHEGTTNQPCREEYSATMLTPVPTHQAPVQLEDYDPFERR